MKQGGRIVIWAKGCRSVSWWGGGLGPGIVLSMLMAVVVHAQPSPSLESTPPPSRLQFEHLATHPFNQTTAILQDHEGFLWLGQRGTGLFKFDGYTHQQYIHAPDDTTSLGKNQIRALFEDRAGTLWVGTQGGGLNRFDREAETFTRFQHDPADPTTISNDSIHVIVEDGAGSLWVGTRHGLNRFDPATETFTRYYLDASSRTHNWIRSLLADQHGTLWVGSWGVNRFDPTTETFSTLLLFPEAPTFERDDADTFVNVVWALHEDAAGRLWVGTERGGVYRFAPETNTFINYRNDPRDVRDLLPAVSWDNNGIPFNADIVWDITSDAEGGLWVGTHQDGLFWIDPASGTSVAFQQDLFDPHSLSSNEVSTVYIDRQGILWIASMDGTLDRVDRASRSFEHIYARLGDPNSLRDSFTWSISDAPDGALWVTSGNEETRTLHRLDRQNDTYQFFQPDPNDPHSLRNGFPVLVDEQGAVWTGGGENTLSRMDPERPGYFIHFQHDPEDPESLPPGRVISLYEDRAGSLWVGTRNFGLSRMEDRAQGRFSRFPFESDHGYVNSIYEDQAGLLWIGTTRGGLYRFDPATETTRNYRPNPDESGSLSSSMIFGICETTQHPEWLWVAAYSGGLRRLQKDTETFTHFTVQNSDLPDNGVQGLLCDAQGRVWMSTDKGLSRFDPTTETFTNYNTDDGIQGLAFNSWAYHQSRHSGEMFFGGPGGINAFSPDALYDNPHPPEVSLTRLRLYNEPVSVGGDSPLQERLSKTEQLTLRHDENDVTFEYVGLHFADPTHNQYQYILEGYEDA